MLVQGRRPFAVPALALIGALLLSACTGAAQPGASNAPSAQGAPVSGGTVTIPIGADPTLNPWSPNAFVESLFINRAIFEGLTKPGKDLAPAPDLAESWTTAADGLSWTFKLRSGVKWSDGTAFSADDVAFTFNDVVLKPDLGAQNRASYAAVKTVTVVDPNTARFDLSRKFAALPSFLAYNAGILPKHVLTSNPLTTTSFNKGTPVSTGPFKVEKYTSGQSVSLVRNDSYFGPKPYLDKVVFTVVPDPNTQIAQALSGDITIMILDNKAAVDRVKTANGLVVASRPLVQYYWLALNQTDQRFTDVRVRQAFVQAIDRQAIITSVERGRKGFQHSRLPGPQARRSPGAGPERERSRGAQGRLQAAPGLHLGDAPVPLPLVPAGGRRAELVAAGRPGARPP